MDQNKYYVAVNDKYVDSRPIIQAKTIYKLIPTTQTQDNAVLLQTTVMWGCGSLKTKHMKIKFKGTKGKWELSDDKRNICVLIKPQTYKTICSNFYNTKWQYDAKLISNAPELLQNFISAINLLKQTTEFEVLDSYKNKVLEFEKVVEETLT